ncbi:MAG: DUF120 domain-containing protein [Candidatus Micrarchaeia archaeon]
MRGELELLILLAAEGAGHGWARLSTAAIARRIGASQQTASRRLAELERAGLVERRRGAVRLTEKSMERLRAAHMSLKALFAHTAITFEGNVFTGLRDGRYYMSLDGYRRQFKEKLGFDPYPGTLNLRVGEPEKKILLAQRNGIEINGFEHNGRVFGGLKAFRARVNGVEGAVVIPARSHYGNDVIEIASGYYLRKKLGLKDGEKAEVVVRD